MKPKGGKKGAQGRGSVSQEPHEEPESSPEDHDALFKLALCEALDDQQIALKLARIVAQANKDLIDNVNSLRAEVRTLRSSLQERDATIEELRGEIQQLRDDNDALEQHGRRHSLRISGISDDQEDTTAAVVNLANQVLELRPPLSAKDISVSHRLRKPRGARPNDPAPIIVRFVSRADRDRVIRMRKKLREMDGNHDTASIYINEDLTKQRAKLFSLTRSLQKNKHFKQTWTFNGNVKVMMQNGDIKSVSNVTDIQELLPTVSLQA